MAMRAVALSLGAKTAAGDYPLALYVGDERDVLRRLRADDAPNAQGVVPGSLTPVRTTAATGALDAQKSRAYLLAAQGTDKQLVHTGQLLFDILDRPEISALWKKERQDAAARRRNPPRVTLRTYLDIRDEALGALPWELLRDGAAMLFNQSWAPLMRWASGSALPDRAADDPGIQWPLRLLVIVGCNPTNKQIGWDMELNDVLATVCPRRHLIDLEVFECRVARNNGVRQELRALVESMRPHVLHFIGHARAEAGGEQAGLELFDTANGNTDILSAQTVIGWFQAVPLRLAILNACRTTAPGAAPDTIAALASVGAAFHAASTPAVVGMQHDIPGLAAAMFAKTLHDSLAMGKQIDEAVVQGRAALLAMPQASEQQRTWALPTLSLGTSPDDVLPMAKNVLLENWQSVMGDKSLQSLTSFVDRRSERRALRDGRSPTPAPTAVAPSPNVILLLGGSQLGKTWLMKCILEWYLLHGHQAVYADFIRARPCNAIDALRHIRGTDKADGHLRPVLPTFGRFNDALNAYLKKQVPDDTKRTGKDENHQYVPGDAHPDTMDECFAIFRDCLILAAEKKQHVIALDHIDKPRDGIVAEDFRDHMVPKLIDPIRLGQVPNVTLLLAASQDQTDAFGLRGLEKTCLVCTINGFDSANWEILAREYAVLEKLDPDLADEFIQQQSQRNTSKGVQYWRPDLLDHMKGILRN